MRSTAGRSRSTPMSTLVAVTALAATGCLASSETQVDPDAGPAIEAGPGGPDPSELSCTPRSVFDEASSSFERWPVGREGDYLEVGFTVRENEREQAEAILGRPCTGTLCTIVSPKTGPLTVEQYELMCRIDAELGPRFWWASNRAS